MFVLFHTIDREHSSAALAMQSLCLLGGESIFQLLFFLPGSPTMPASTFPRSGSQSVQSNASIGWSSSISLATTSVQSPPNDSSSQLTTFQLCVCLPEGSSLQTKCSESSPNLSNGSTSNRTDNSKGIFKRFMKTTNSVPSPASLAVDHSLDSHTSSQTSINTPGTHEPSPSIITPSSTSAFTVMSQPTTSSTNYVASHSSASRSNVKKRLSSSNTSNTLLSSTISTTSQQKKSSKWLKHPISLMNCCIRNRSNSIPDNINKGANQSECKSSTMVDKNVTSSSAAPVECDCRPDSDNVNSQPSPRSSFIPVSNVALSTSNLLPSQQIDDSMDDPIEESMIDQNRALSNDLDDFDSESYSSDSDDNVDNVEHFLCNRIIQMVNHQALPDEGASSSAARPIAHPFLSDDAPSGSGVAAAARPNLLPVSPNSSLFSPRPSTTNSGAAVTPQLPFHTRIDYINCLVPDLYEISKCSFYWGKMDRYEAERLLDNQPEGTFLLRDSAQEDYLFSVSFRRFDRSLHARIEQYYHQFSFDSHDPGVYSSSTVTGLIEHYKDPSHCMFFEPMLTKPLNRNFTFSLQHLARVVVCDRITYDSVNELQLPVVLKRFLREYHYRHKVRTKHFDDMMMISYPNHYVNDDENK